MVDRKGRELQRPQVGQVVIREKGAPTRIRGVCVESELQMQKAEWKTYKQMGLDGPPPKIRTAGPVPGHPGGIGKKTTGGVEAQLERSHPKARARNDR